MQRLSWTGRNWTGNIYGSFPLITNGLDSVTLGSGCLSRLPLFLLSAFVPSAVDRAASLLVIASRLAALSVVYIYVQDDVLAAGFLEN